MKGAANVSLSMKDILAVEFPLPPIERQRELCKKLDLYNELMKEIEHQKRLGEALMFNILKDTFEGK